LEFVVVVVREARPRVLDNISGKRNRVLLLYYSAALINNGQWPGLEWVVVVVMEERVLNNLVAKTTCS
jgi:hypothetical protein